MAAIYIHQPTSRIRELKSADLLFLINMAQQSRDQCLEFDPLVDVSDVQRIIDVLTEVLND